MSIARAYRQGGRFANDPVNTGAILSGVSLASAGGETLVTDGTGPDLEVKGLTAGTGVGLVAGGTAITINNTDGASTVTMADDGGIGTIIVDGTGPALQTKSIIAGTGIQVQSFIDNVAVVNTSPATDVTLTSAGGTTLVTDGTGPTLAVKGLTAGTDITFVDDGTQITINGVSAGGVTLGTGAGEQSLVENGVGPALTTKALSEGVGINLSGAASAVTISTDIIANTGGADVALLDTTATPTLQVKGLTAGTLVDLTDNGAGGDVLVAVDSDVTNLTVNWAATGLSSTFLNLAQAVYITRIGNIVYLTFEESDTDGSYSGGVDQSCDSGALVLPAQYRPAADRINMSFIVRNGPSRTYGARLVVHPTSPYFELFPEVGGTFFTTAPDVLQWYGNTVSYRLV